METKKLYYVDSHRKKFAATVVSCREEETGLWVALDATAFYPVGGGQPCDLGRLGNTQVLEVQEQGETVWHRVEKPLAEGMTVQGEIDWSRRFDFMQQHTAEHMISGIANRLYGCHNVGFHMGADVITLDFDKMLPEDALPELERLANQAILENLEVHCTVPSEQELATITYRTKKALPWPVRLVEIPGIDTCACCGVHTKTTGELGVIKLLSCVKFHQGVRIEMVAGGRAYRLLSQVFAQNKLVSQAFSAKILETGLAAQRIQDALSAEKQRAAELERRLMDAISAGFAQQGDVLYFTKDLPARPLAEKIAQVCGGTAAVFSGNDQEGYSLCVISKIAEVSQLGRKLTENLNGKGGGKAGFFQGSVQATEAEIRTIW